MEVALGGVPPGAARSRDDPPLRLAPGDCQRFHCSDLTTKEWVRSIGILSVFFTLTVAFIELQMTKPHGPADEARNRP